MKSIFCPVEIRGCSHKHGGKPWATVPRLEAAKHTNDSFQVKEVALVSRRHALGLSTEYWKDNDTCKKHYISTSTTSIEIKQH